jgi:hypothetical protein
MPGITRRNFALLAAAGLTVTVGGWAVAGRRPRVAGSLLDEDERALLFVLTARLCAGAELGLSSEQLTRVRHGAVALVERILRGSELYVPEFVNQVRSALTFVEYAPAMLGKWSRFSTLEAELQHEVLRQWMSSDNALARDVFMAFKGLCTMAFYEQPLVCERLGYDLLPQPAAPPQERLRILQGSQRQDAVRP